MYVHHPAHRFPMPPWSASPHMAGTCPLLSRISNHPCCPPCPPATLASFLPPFALAISPVWGALSLVKHGSFPSFKSPLKCSIPERLFLEPCPKEVLLSPRSPRSGPLPISIKHPSDFLSDIFTISDDFLSLLCVVCLLYWNVSSLGNTEDRL